ncbi:MAG: FtsW/RodA/SpoVE family cell cycle protein [Anaerolineales bacterium]|jgi:cell division protein FtsW (lipid II flippase)
MLIERNQSSLLKLAGVFLVLFAAILSLSPSVRERSWDVQYRWQHWIGLLAWAAAFAFAHRETRRYLPERDPYLLPVAALLTGWGLLTIWRLTPEFGLRQTLWMSLAVGLLAFSLRFSLNLEIVRRYKYILLASGLILTFLTLIFGTNPAGTGPRLWLGCCGVYLQPSEPLKLLLVGYLAAYLADRLPARDRLIPLLFPTLLVTGLALLLLLVQRDLGTASIFILLYATIVYIAIGRKRLLFTSAIMLLVAGMVGYFLISLIQLRIDAWINPWLDPSGRAFQIVQSLLAIANGGIVGRGPGLGSPTLVPISHSDFIFTAIAEETGLVGVIGLLSLLAILIGRGLRVAFMAPDRFRRLLATGITAYFSIQSLLIIGGNLRILPLTGVTLPYVSYGGSSLLTSFVGLLALLVISNQSEEEPAPLPKPIPYFVISGMIGLSLIAISLGTGWWVLVRGADLLNRTDNARRAISDRYVQRGALLDRENFPINETDGEVGNLFRAYLYPELGPIVGYTHSVFGQAGLEAALDDYLRGLQGNPASLVWWDRLLYGTPPPGLNIRLSLDLSLQAEADHLLGNHAGAVVLINARTGEILAMASHPTYDPNQLDELGNTLSGDSGAPLLNRAAQGQYLPDNVLNPFTQALFGSSASIGNEQRNELYNALGFYNEPQLRMQVAEAGDSPESLRVSPLQIALATAAMSNNGIRPAPRVALAVNTPQQGWVILPALGKPTEAIPAPFARETALELADNNPYWSFTSASSNSALTWYLAGTLPDWNGTPLALVVLLEENNRPEAVQIGEELFEIALQQ